MLAIPIRLDYSRAPSVRLAFPEFPLPNPPLSWPIEGRGTQQGCCILFARGSLTSARLHSTFAPNVLLQVLGGGQCGLSNYRTLCVPCHQEATKRLAKERVKPRSMKRVALGPGTLSDSDADEAASSFGDDETAN